MSCFCVILCLIFWFLALLLSSFHCLLCSSLCAFPSCACLSPSVCQYCFLCDSPSLSAAPPHLFFILSLVSVHIVFVFPARLVSLMYVFSVLFPPAPLRFLLCLWSPDMFLDFDFCFFYVWFELCFWLYFVLALVSFCCLGDSVLFFLFFGAPALAK